MGEFNDVHRRTLRGNMKQSVTQILDFFKKHKYGRMSLALLLVGLVLSSTVLLRPKPKEADSETEIRNRRDKYADWREGY